GLAGGGWQAFRVRGPKKPGPLRRAMGRVLGLAGRRRRDRRERLGWTQRELAARPRLSIRFLAQLEHGEGNISLARLAALADALGVEITELLRPPAPAPDAPRHVALLGLRGAGKSTIGARLAGALGP